MNKLILISGDLAAGKSTLAGKLSKKYSIACFNKDNIKEILGDNFGFANREENLKLSICTFDIFKYITSKMIIAKKDLILESNFRDHEFAYLEKLCLENNYSIYTIFLNCDIKLLHQRFMNRILNENRHIVHKAVDFTNYYDFEKQILSDREKNQNRQFKGKVLYLDSSDFTKLYSKGMNEIDAFIKENK